MKIKEKPLISFCLFAYNQEKYIKDAVEGALNQTYTPLEIIISDDCSSDDTFKIIQEEVASYTGPHTIVINKNNNNLGICNHVNEIMQLVKSELIVVAAGDDISVPERVEKIYNHYLASGKTSKSIFSNVMVIDENGNSGALFGERPNPDHLTIEWFSKNMCSVYGCSQAWTKDLFDKFGPIKYDVINEDQVIPFRAALVGAVTFIEEPLVYYRRHTTNTWKSEECLDDLGALQLSRRKQCDNFLGIHRNWLVDIIEIKNGNKEGIENIDAITARIEKKISELQSEIALYGSGIFTNISTLFKSFFDGMSLKKCAMLLSFYNFPRGHIFYLKTKRMFRKLLGR